MAAPLRGGDSPGLPINGGQGDIWDTMSDTWAATDALGRSLPTREEAGPPRPHKFVGIFYFLWLGQHGGAGPFDISKILAADPTAMANPSHPAWGPLYAPHHWGESWFGYYTGTDEGVLRKHAQMLADAGVDAVIFDVTNQLTYPESYRALCKVFAEMRDRGLKVPQIAFLCPFWDPNKVVRELYANLYSRNFHPELWFRWEGKPLILADSGKISPPPLNDKQDVATASQPGHTLGQTFEADKSFEAVGVHCPTWTTTNSAMTMVLRKAGPTGEMLASRRFENVADNSWISLELSNALPAGRYYLEMTEAKGPVGWWSHSRDVYSGGEAYADGLAAGGDRTLRIASTDAEAQQIRSFFTFRKPQPDYFTGPRGPGEWGWLEVFPQHVFYQAPGVPEQVTVGVAQNAVDGKLSVLSNPRSHGRSFHQGAEPGPEGRDFTGRNFAEQWERALAIDPALIFITGWNEWIAGRFDIKAPFHAPGPVTFVDQFNPEYSRDIEPVKGGHEDDYFYQMVANIRRFKGVRPLPVIAPSRIKIDGKFNDWIKVAPEFRDTVGDPVQRDHSGWGKETRYTNHTGRNDIVSAKVSWDGKHVYFYVRTRDPLTSRSNANWMLLFIDADHNPATGWLGYDFVVNRLPAREKTASIERHDGHGCRWSAAVEAPVRAGERELELAVPRQLLGLKTLPATLDFKWADNIQQTGEVSDFTLNGDAAPNDRYNYRAKLVAGRPSSPQP